MNPPIFREVQHFFRQWIFLLPVAAVTIIVWYEFIQQVILGRPQGEQPIPNWLAWLLTLIFGIGFPVVGFLLRLVTEVRPGELAVALRPFHRRIIPLDTIAQAMVREYSPIREYGGWGIRMSRANGRAYNAHGNQGVQLVLDSGWLVLVGSQRPHELLAALETAGLKPAKPAKAAKPAKPAPTRRRIRAREDAE